MAARLAVRPVFTAHPTEAARRTTLAQLRASRRPAGGRGRARPDAGDAGPSRLAEVVELLWLTDDLRIARPEPLDEARNAIYYFDELFQRRPCRYVLDELQATFARLGVELRPDGPAAGVRHLDRRRPRRQPQRHRPR